MRETDDPPKPAAAGPEPPKAPTEAFEHEEHGVRRPDPWHWLKDREDPRTMAYLRDENAYTEAHGRSIFELAETLFAEMKSRLKETDLSVPWRKGEYVYYARTVEGLVVKVGQLVIEGHVGEKTAEDLDDHRQALALMSTEGQ